MEYAKIAWQADGRAINLDRTDIYHSAAGGIAEKRHVFIQTTGLPRLLTLRKELTIAEIGFGLGLNFALLLRQATDARAADHANDPNAKIRVYSAEYLPPRPADLARAATHFPELAPEYAQILSLYADLRPGWNIWNIDAIELRLFIGDARAMLADTEFLADIWWLDGFAPRSNSDAWSADLFSLVARHSAPDCILTTYSVSKTVRDNLSAAGFAPRMMPGFADKRFCLLAQPRKHPATPLTNADPPQIPTAFTPPSRVIIVGCGLAGLATALAFRLYLPHIALEIWDAADGPCAQGSGNPAGLCLPVPGNPSMPYVGLHNAGQAFTARLLGIDNGAGVDTTILSPQIPDHPLIAALHARTDRCGYAALATHIPTRRGGQARAGQTSHQTLRGMVLYPAALGATLTEILAANGVITRFGRRMDAATIARASADPDTTLVFCAGDAWFPGEFALFDDLPLQRVRGQVNWFAKDYAPAHTQPLQGASYYIPGYGERHLCGATFERLGRWLDRPPGPDENSPTDFGNRQNALNFSQLMRERRNNPTDALTPVCFAGGRAAVRLHAPDAMPIAGMLPDPQWWRTRRGELAERHFHGEKNALPNIPTARQLLVNTAHGSHGLSTAFICGFLVARLAAGMNAGLDNRLSAALSPARFYPLAIRRLAGVNTNPKIKK